MGKYEDLTFDEWVLFWDDLNKALFKPEEAKAFREMDRLRNNALRKLWNHYGLKTIGEFEAWEKEHMAEKKAFLERELNARS